MILTGLEPPTGTVPRRFIWFMINPDTFRLT